MINWTLHFFVVFQGILLGFGLQHKTVEDIERELDLPSSQILGLFNRIIRKVVQVRASFFWNSEQSDLKLS